jgi:hypothetical protein
MAEKKVMLVIKNLKTEQNDFVRKDTVVSPHHLAFLLIKRKKITKLNSLPT